MAPILRAENLNKTFGAVTAADDINVAIEPGEVIGVIGSNGAGKTTFVNMVTGYLTPSSGKLYFYDRDITGFDPKHATELGICRSFQIPQLFATATTFENLLIAMGVAETGAMPFWQPLPRQTASRAAKRSSSAIKSSNTATNTPKPSRKACANFSTSPWPASTTPNS